MKKYLLPAVILMLLSATLASCKKGGSGNGNCNETAMQVTTTPANGSNEAPAPGPNFTLKVNIASLPAGGATIEVKARPDGNNTPFFTSSINATAGDNNFTITSTPISTTCVVDITITSKSCANNKWTGGYRYSRK